MSAITSFKIIQRSPLSVPIARPYATLINSNGHLISIHGWDKTTSGFGWRTACEIS